jgi:hypothetical protein
VQFKGLMMAQVFATVLDEHPLHDEIVAVLESFDTTNIDIMRSTMVVDAMNSYGMLESPIEVSHVTAEIKEFLRGDLTNEQCERAYGLVTAQFEDIVGEAYWTAIDALDPQQRTELYTVAALGAPPHGFWNDWLLRRLIETADRRTLPAFELWATRLNMDTSYIQGVGACYALAMEGSALLMETPPQLTDCQGQDTEAWQCYGAIIFWLQRPGLSKDDITERCAPLWCRLVTDLAQAAADALYWLAHATVAASSEGRPILPKLIDAFREELRNMLEWSLKHRQSLTSIFGHRGHGSLLQGRDSLADYIIGTLGYVGNVGTVELLRTYADDPILGSTAIKSIRKLIEGQA